MASRSVKRARSRGFLAPSNGNMPRPKNAENKSADAAEKPPPAKDGLSALAAKVLDQLSLTSWLPASPTDCSFSGVVPVSAYERYRPTASNTGARRGAISVARHDAALLVIATMITQAFSFSAIRTLEGYWSHGGPAGALASLMTRRHVRKKSHHHAVKQTYERRAFAAARETMLSRGIPVSIVCTLEARLYGQSVSIPLSEVETLDIEAMRWEDYCSPWQAQKLDQSGGATPIYPAQTSRILPTSLGNRLRATEDSLENTNGDLEGLF